MWAWCATNTWVQGDVWVSFEFHLRAVTVAVLDVEACVEGNEQLDHARPALREGGQWTVEG